MIYKVSLTYYVILNILLSLVGLGSGDVYYIPNFTDLEVCDNFSNDFVDLSAVSIATQPPSEGGAVGLSGNISMLNEIGDSHNIALSVEKQIEMTTETLFTSKLSVCEAIKDKDAPWFPLIEEMGITGCPISSQIYPIGYFAISLEPYSDILTREYCGEYIIEVCVEHELDKLSCHKLGLEIVERNDD